MSSQMIYIIIALFLFMNLVVMANRMISDQMMNVFQSQEYYIAASLSQSIIEEGWLHSISDLTDYYNNKTFTKSAGGIEFTIKTKVTTFIYKGKSSFRLLEINIIAPEYKVNLNSKFVYSDI